MFFGRTYPALHQTVCGLFFSNPIGLAAGFDYQARLPRLMPSLGFGFGTVGTLTNRPYGGNPGPMLGRLPKSRSLLVNKGFKNEGIGNVLGSMSPEPFSYPVGISIGRSNDGSCTTEESSIADIVDAFKTAEASSVPFAYYELNISCPNLSSGVEFYNPSALRKLLEAVGVLGISRPIFIKMPISKTDHEILAIADEASRHAFVKGLIIGNLQRDRSHSALKSDEVAKCTVGNFSGKPCRARSDELISLVYQHYRERFVIIGCGGVFNEEDAYQKLARGATLVMLITGLVYEGPQLVADINERLIRRLEREGKKSVSELIGILETSV